MEQDGDPAETEGAEWVGKVYTIAWWASTGTITGGRSQGWWGGCPLWGLKCQGSGSVKNPHHRGAGNYPPGEEGAAFPSMSSRRNCRFRSKGCGSEHWATLSFSLPQIEETPRWVGSVTCQWWLVPWTCCVKNEETYPSLLKARVAHLLLLLLLLLLVINQALC